MNFVNRRIDFNKKINKYYVYGKHMYKVLAKPSAFNVFFVNANGPIRPECLPMCWWKFYVENHYIWFIRLLA